MRLFELLRLGLVIACLFLPVRFVCAAGAPRSWAKLDINSKFDRLLANYTVDCQMEDSLYLPLEEEEWVALYQRRIAVYDRISQEDDSIIAAIFDYYKYAVNIPHYQYDTLIAKTSDFYRKTMDSFMTEHLVSLAMTYFSKTNDQDHLFQCKAMMGLALTQIGHEGEHSEYLNGLKYLNQAADYCVGHYKTFRTQDEYDYMTRVYQELLHIRWLDMRRQSMYDTYARYLELQEMYNWLCQHPEIPDIQVYRDRVQKNYFDYEYNILSLSMSERSPYFSDPMVRLLSKFAKKHHDLKNTLWEEHHTQAYMLQPRYWAQYFQIMHFNDLASARETLQGIDSIYQKVKVKGTKKGKYPMPELIGYISDAVYYLDLTDELSEADKQRYASAYLQDLMEYARLARSARRQTSFYDRLELLVTNPHFYKYLSEESRQELIFNVLVSCDAEVYAHSTLVSWIAWNLLETIIEDKPSLLVGSLGCNTREQVQANKASFHNYIHEACMMHDLGLNRMSLSTNRHYRSQTSHELQMLRQHSPNGASIVKISPVNTQYYDMIMGHHKWYNGSGYPQAFDNVSSPYCFLIDLLSISDYLEGGSEVPDNGGLGGYEGRYATLLANAGSRFNPEIVRVLTEHDKLQWRLQDLCNVGQLHLRYTVYQSYLNKNQ